MDYDWMPSMPSSMTALCMCWLSCHVEARVAAGARSIVLIAECESQLITTIQSIEDGGWGLDGVWSDDFHHISRVALTGRGQAYYSDYRGTAQEFLSVIKRGFVYQGQRYQWQEKPRGTVVKMSRRPDSSFICKTMIRSPIICMEIASMHTGILRYQVIAALLLLAPELPMLFMGQEFGASNPFLFLPITTRTWPQKCTRAAGNFSPSFGVCDAGGQAAVRIRLMRQHFSGPVWILSERSRNAPIYRFCTRIYCVCVATMPSWRGRIDDR